MPDICQPELSAAITRDIGVRITRIRLPSGSEVLIVERTNEQD